MGTQVSYKKNDCMISCDAPGTPCSMNYNLPRYLKLCEMLAYNLNDSIYGSIKGALQMKFKLEDIWILGSALWI